MNRFFHEGALLSSALDHDRSLRIMRGGFVVLSELRSAETLSTSAMLAVDAHNSAFSGPGSGNYTAYGYRQRHTVERQVGFNGECRDMPTQCDLLGNGRRLYNPALMRFHSADVLSPFGQGGLNAYVYCENDGINFIDPSGRVKANFFAMRGIPSDMVRAHHASAQVPRVNRTPPTQIVPATRSQPAAGTSQSAGHYPVFERIPKPGRIEWEGLLNPGDDSGPVAADIMTWHPKIKPTDPRGYELNRSVIRYKLENTLGKVTDWSGYNDYIQYRIGSMRVKRNPDKKETKTSNVRRDLVNGINIARVKYVEAGKIRNPE